MPVMTLVKSVNHGKRGETKVEISEKVLIVYSGLNFTKVVGCDLISTSYT